MFRVARTKGARNADYDEERLDLARRVRQRILAPDGLRTSLRELAQAAESSVATLKHYFGDRDGLVQAVMESARIDSSPYLAMASAPIEGDVRASLLSLVERLAQAWVKYGVGGIHTTSLAAGFSSRELGTTYVNLLLEPLLQTAESRIRRHVELGEMEPCNERFAALALLSPVVLGLLHQVQLGGKDCRPLDVDAFFKAHVDAFLKGYPATNKGRRDSPA
jgi:AcrR family transcriptional regulator